MLLNFVHFDASLWIFVQKPRNQIPETGGYGNTIRIFNAVVVDGFDQQGQTVALEGHVPDHECIERYAQRPHVKCAARDGFVALTETFRLKTMRME